MARSRYTMTTLIISPIDPIILIATCRNNGCVTLCMREK